MLTFKSYKKSNIQNHLIEMENALDYSEEKRIINAKL